MTETNSPRKRASRHKRPDKPPHFRLTSRDMQVIRAVNDYRLLRQDQIQRLLFPSRNTAQVRLQLLWAHGYLKRDWPPHSGGIQTSPVIYSVDKRGVDLLVTECGYERAALRWSKSNVAFDFSDHTLGLADIRVAVELTCRQNNLQLRRWQDERALKADYDRVQLDNKMVPVLPDAYLVIGLNTGTIHFFVEYDRGSENLRFFQTKLSAYAAYFQSGKCKARYGTDKIRVLTVCKGGQGGVGETRMGNLRKRAQSLSEHRWFWFSTLEQVLRADFLHSPIWWRADASAPGSIVV